MCTNCASLVADLFLFCYKRDFIMSFSDDEQADIFDAFNTTSSCFDILNINNNYFDNTASKYTLYSFILVKPIPLIPKPRF